MSAVAPLKAESTGLRRLPLAAVAILILTAAVILVWGHFKLLDQDEVFVLQTDSVASLRQMVDVQLHDPISLDPLFYHLLGHASVGLFGATAFGIRLPSLFGYLLMQVCLYFIVRRMMPGVADERAGVIACAVPALTATLYYGVEARPYGVLLGLAALMLLSWQHVTRDDAAHRTGWLITLAVSITLALNTHYFAVLLMIPLCAAELYRMMKLLRIDWPVALAIILGMAGIAFALPFQKSAGEYRKHYYNAGHVGLHAISQAYRALFVAYTDYSMAVQHLLMSLLVTFVLLVIAAVWVVLRDPKRPVVLPPAERVFLLALAALPFFGFLLAKFVTHSIEVRYVLCAIIAIAVFLAVALEPLLRIATRYQAAVAALLLFIVLGGAERVREQQAKTHELLSGLVLSPALQARLMATPAEPIYIQNIGVFEESVPYISDPALRSRFTLIYSAKDEIRWAHHDTGALTAEHMQHFTPLRIVRYEDLKQQPGEHLMLLLHGSWDWTDPALQNDGAQITPLGKALQGDVDAVRFPNR